MAIAGFTTFQWWGVLSAFLLLVVSAVGFYINWTRWHTFSLSINPGDRAIWERNGFGMIAERRINLGFVGSLLFSQTIMGRLLDYGTLSVGVMGGPYEWQNVGRFRTLRRIIESNCEWTPQPRIALRVSIRERLNLVTIYFRQTLEHLRRWWTQRPRRILTPLAVNRPRQSLYERFLRYVERYLFHQNIYNFETVANVSGGGEPEFTPAERKMFMHILKLRHILMIDKWGRVYCHPRIQSPQDVLKRIPAEWFNGYSQHYKVQEP